MVGTRAIEIIRLDSGDNAELIVGAREASDPIDGGPSHGSPRAEWPPDSTIHSMAMPGILTCTKTACMWGP